MKSKVKIGLVLFCGIFSIANAMSCKDFKSGNGNYHDNMDKLMRKAKVYSGDNYFNRYQEDFVYELCHGLKLNNDITYYTLNAKQIRTIRKILNK